MSIFNKTKKSKVVTRGKLIVIDGIDGSGKTIQTDLLAKTMSINGYSIETISFPQYQNDESIMLTKYLNGQLPEITDPRAIAVFFGLDRLSAKTKIEKWLQEGKYVLANRYVSANSAHQGSKIKDKGERLKFYKWLHELEYEIFGLPQPDFTIIADMPVELAQTLIKQKPKAGREYIKDNSNMDIHEKDPEHLHDSARTFREIARLFPNTKIVKCNQDTWILPPQTIHNKIWELIRRIVLKNQIPKEKII